VELTVLSVPGCPNAALLDERLAAAAAGLPAVTVSWRVVDDEQLAAVLGMRGSPTLLIDLADPFAVPGQPAGLSCRLYPQADGSRGGAPSVESLRRALEHGRRWLCLFVRVRNPARPLAVVFHAWIPADSCPPQGSPVFLGVIPGHRVQHIAVVKNYQISAIPLMDIDELPLCQVGHQFIEQLRAIAVQAGTHSGERPVHPVHLRSVAQVQGPAAGHRMTPDHRLTLRPFVLLQRTYWPSVSYIVFRAISAIFCMKADEILNLHLHGRGQCVERGCAVGK
jgi:hypothetical protein